MQDHTFLFRKVTKKQSFFFFAYKKMLKNSLQPQIVKVRHEAVNARQI